MCVIIIIIYAIQCAVQYISRTTRAHFQLTEVDCCQVALFICARLLPRDMLNVKQTIDILS